MADSVGDQFKGLDMENLIAAPLKEACEAQSMLASSAEKFIKDISFEESADGRMLEEKI